MQGSPPGPRAEEWSFPAVYDEMTPPTGVLPEDRADYLAFRFRVQCVIFSPSVPSPWTSNSTILLFLL